MSLQALGVIISVWDMAEVSNQENGEVRKISALEK